MLRNRKTMIAAGAAITAAAALVVVQLVGAQSGRTNAKATDVLGVVGPPVQALTVNGSQAQVDVIGGEEATNAESLWFGGLAAAMLAAQQPGLDNAVIITSGSSSAPARDAVHFNDRVNGASSPEDSAQLTGWINDARLRARDAGATITRTRVVPAFGGAVELTMKPFDAVGFATSAASTIGGILGPLAGPGRAYFVQVVDSSAKPILELSFNPGIGGSTGQGSGWAAPNVQTDAIWGRAGGS